MRRHGATVGILSAVFVVLGFASIARAEDEKHQKRNNYNATILVSNEADDAPVVDPLLKNAWGISASPTGPWWVADNGTGYSTLYNGDGEKISLEVQVPGAPTGTVFNGGTQFQLAAGAPAAFLFASEDGTFSGWNPTVNANAQVVFTSAGSNYKGMAIHGDTLYASDFGLCKVEAFQGNFFDNTFAEVTTAGGFADGSIPAKYCPFGIQAVGDSVFVTYAKKDGEDDVPGRGHGFVREFDTDGNLTAKVESRGALNSPWGIAMAPADFGKFSGCLLVGNFGDGRINAFCEGRHGNWHFDGRLRHRAHAISIDGLWGIGFGNGGAAGAANVLYFAAGPDDEENGYYGKIEVVER
jgi:uncharacterized protein (TIGR03118 family)